MHCKAVQHNLRIGPLKDATKEPVIVNTVRYINGSRTLGRVIDGREPFLIQHNPAGATFIAAFIGPMIITYVSR